MLDGITPNITAESRRKLRKNLLRYIKSEAKKGLYPTHTELEKKFHTNIRTHFSGIEEAYRLANVPYKGSLSWALEPNHRRNLFGSTSGLNDSEKDDTVAMYGN